MIVRKEECVYTIRLIKSRNCKTMKLPFHIKKWGIDESPNICVKTIASRYIFLVTSTIRPSNMPLSYTRTRSVFSTTERFEQTLHSLETIRSKVPEVLIVLLENSDLTGREEVVLKKSADWVVSFAQNSRAVALRDSPFKGAGEVYMLLSIQHIIQNFDYEKIFKLSGRYWLSDRFDVQCFPNDKFGFLLRDGSYSTRLYSAPKTLEGLYQTQLRMTFKAALEGASIESMITHGIPPSKIELLPFIGVRGQVAVCGDYIDE